MESMASPSPSTDAQDNVNLWNPLVVQYGFYSPLMSGSIDGTDSAPHDKAIRRALKADCTCTRSSTHIKICTAAVPSLSIANLKKFQFMTCMYLSTTNECGSCLPVSSSTIVILVYLFMSTDRPNKLVRGDPENTVFVARLSHRTTQGQLYTLSSSLVRREKCTGWYTESNFLTACTTIFFLLISEECEHNV